jgi:IclR family acetate operon transcriptional repressor
VLSSAANALRAVEFLVERGEVGVSELSRHLGVTVGTGHRILTTLVDTGFAEQNLSSRRYRPSGKILALAQQVRARVNIRDRVHLHMVELMQEVGETVHLAVLEDGQVVCVDKAAPDQMVRVEFRVGARLPVHSTALGKALAAFDDSADVRALLRAAKASRQPGPVPSVAEFREELAGGRAAGVAEARGEYLPDVDSVAAPIRGAGGTVIAAIDVSAPRSRFETAGAILRREVEDAAERISEQLHQHGANDLTA